MKLYGLQKLTLLDFPEHLAALVFLGGCNFRCPFCQNSSLVLPQLTAEEVCVDPEEFFSFLKKRCGILDGVCISGGEPTLQKELPDLIQRIRDLGYAVKLDTNGSRPEVLEALLKDNLLDYVAMDLKGGISHYLSICGLTDDRFGNQLLTFVNHSITLLQQSGIPYEFRTTAVKGLHTSQDFAEIADWIANAPRYYLQNFRDSDMVLDRSRGFSPFSEEELTDFLNILCRKIPNAQLRSW